MALFMPHSIGRMASRTCLAHSGPASLRAPVLLIVSQQLPIGSSRTSTSIFSSSISSYAKARSTSKQPIHPLLSLLPTRPCLAPLPLRSPVSGRAILDRLAAAFHSSARRANANSVASATTALPETSSSFSSSSSPPPSEPTARIVGYHSLFLAFLVYTIVLVGGLTRLTESGLSITEWNPGFKGMWLPSTDEQWEGEWAKYRETPEFTLLNSKMTMEDFKTIYMWEWSHRILGRLIGVAYVLPALYFVARGYVKAPYRSKLLLIGLGIGAQGAMGWYMVKSGLAAPEGTLHADPVEAEPQSGALAPPKSQTPASWTPRVSHFRLAAHLGLAFIVYAGMLRTGLSVLRDYNLAKNVGKASGLATGPAVRERLIAVLARPEVKRYRRFVASVTGLVFLTAMSGALVAGLDAGLVYNEFPTMGDGRVAPPLDEMFDERYARTAGPSPDGNKSGRPSFILHNLTQNPVTVQFVHRCLAITTFIHVVLVAYKAKKLNLLLKASSTGPTVLPPAIPRLANLALLAGTMQASLGISTLIYMVPIELASAHQAGSVALLSVMLALWGTLRVPASGGIAAMAKQAAAVTAAARSGSAVGVSAAAGAPNLARAMHTRARAAIGIQKRTFATSMARRSLGSLPDKVKLMTGPAGRLSKVLPARETDEITTRVGSSYGGNHTLQWLETPRNLLIVTKRHDGKTWAALKEVITHVNEQYPEMNVVLEEANSAAFADTSLSNLYTLRDTTATSTKAELARKIDIVLTLGGDGTILHASSLFSHCAVPPVLSFSMGTLGFLLPWNISSFQSAFKSLLSNQVTLLLRMRLKQTMHEKDGALVCGSEKDGKCEVGENGEIHLMNEVTLHRGREPHMTTIDAFVDGRHLTRAISDGLIIASPTGSTAYSLSAGGPIVHPSVQSLILTPICPRSLSFRPLLLPSDSTIQLKINSTSRSPAELTIDGREIRVLEPGQYLEISMSPFPIPCVNRSGLQGEGDLEEPRLVEARGDDQDPPPTCSVNLNDRGPDDWVGDINTLLRFNASFAGRGLVAGGSESEGDYEREK